MSSGNTMTEKKGNTRDITQLYNDLDIGNFKFSRTSTQANLSFDFNLRVFNLRGVWNAELSTMCKDCLIQYLLLQEN